MKEIGSTRCHVSTNITDVASCNICKVAVMTVRYVGVQSHTGGHLAMQTKTGSSTPKTLLVELMAILLTLLGKQEALPALQHRSLVSTTLRPTGCKTFVPGLTMKTKAILTSCLRFDIGLTALLSHMTNNRMRSTSDYGGSSETSESRIAVRKGDKVATKNAERAARPHGFGFSRAHASECYATLSYIDGLEDFQLTDIG